MDSGYLEPGETMDDDYDFSRILLPVEIIGIIDQLLCHEVSLFVYRTMRLAMHRGEIVEKRLYRTLLISQVLEGVIYVVRVGNIYPSYEKHSS